MKDVADLLGRVFIGFIFLYEALDLILFFDNNKKTMANYGINWQPNIIVYALVIFLLIGAILVIIGYYANIGAIFLLIYWIPFSLIVYSFWNDPPHLQRINALYLMRNLAVVGGLLMIAANGSGKYSVKRVIHVMKLPH